MILANLSGGRDSSAMVIKWLELGNKLDYIIFCDTGFEFAEMYEYIDKLDSYLTRNFNKSITRIDKSQEILKWAFSYSIVRGERAGQLRGLPRVLGHDYCTRETKIRPTREFVLEKTGKIDKFLNTALIGYTYNEVEEGRNSTLDYAVARYPLHEWGMNEKEVSDFLSARGVMNPLYNRFQRTGCYLCPKQSKKSLFHVWKYYKKEWEEMKNLEAKACALSCVNQTFKPGKSLIEFEKEFLREGLDLFVHEEFEPLSSCFCKG